MGLEARVPFAARSLVELAGRIGPATGLRGGVEKWLLREALRGIVPESIRTRRDRKSTRLNSSHLVISYAVFCLKKKIKTCKCMSYCSPALFFSPNYPLIER